MSSLLIVPKRRYRYLFLTDLVRVTRGKLQWQCAFVEVTVSEWPSWFLQPLWQRKRLRDVTWFSLQSHQLYQTVALGKHFPLSCPSLTKTTGVGLSTVCGLLKKEFGSLVSDKEFFFTMNYCKDSTNNLIYEWLSMPFMHTKTHELWNEYLAQAQNKVAFLYPLFVFWGCVFYIWN